MGRLKASHAISGFGVMLSSPDSLNATLAPGSLRRVHHIAEGKVANFVTPDGTVLDLFWEPELAPPDPDPRRAFTRANHLAFDIAPELFDQAVEVLRRHQIAIDHGPVSRPTGRGIYFYDPDGFLIEIRCDPQA